MKTERGVYEVVFHCEQNPKLTQVGFRIHSSSECLGSWYHIDISDREILRYDLWSYPPSPTGDVLDRGLKRLD